MIKRKKKDRSRFSAISSLYHSASLMSHFGDKVALRYFDSSNKVCDLTYSQLQSQIFGLACGLKASGLGGKRIAVIGETSPDWICTYYATVISGGVIIPMDKELQVEEIAGFLAFAEIDAIVYSESFHDKFASIRETHPCTHTFIPTGQTIESCKQDNIQILPLRDLYATGATASATGSETLSEPEDSDRMAVMLFTSGTTGSSQCVMLSERNVVAATSSAIATVDFSEEDTTVSVLPIHHTYELCITLAELSMGLTVCINDNLRHVLRNFAYFKPTGLILVPLFVNTMYKKIMDEVRKKGMEKKLKTGLKLSKVARKVGIDLSASLFGQITSAFGGNLTKIICGGAALNPEMVEVFGEFGIQICEGYGITECSPLVAVTPYFAPKRGSVGPAVPSCVTRIDVGDNTEKNDRGYVEGEICVKGDNVMLGYYKNPGATAEVFTEDGYFRTGDIGYMDKDGYIYITGRKKFVIVLENGKNVFPEEIEEYLENIPEIAESVVLGRRADDGETINLVAVVFPNKDVFPEGAAQSEIEEAIKDKIASVNKKLVRYKQIKSVEFRDEEFEKTTSKKIKRHLVK